MKSKIYIAIVGLPGSGKSAAAEFFRSGGFTILRFGDQTDIGVKEQGLPLTEENERKYREKIRRDLGMAAMAIKIEPRIREAQAHTDHIVLDGMRSWEEYLYLKKKFPSIVTLAIYASPAIRYRRLGVRSERPLTEKESKARDYAEIEHLNSGGPIAIADYIIKNETTTGQLEAELKIFLRTV